MGPCARAACDPGCLDHPAVGRSRVRQAGRAVLGLTAALTGAGLVVLTSTIPGHGRTRRCGWALRQASRWTLHGLGVRVEQVGRLRSGPSLVVGNHISFLDILALSATAPMRQVAKREVSLWPVVGGLARRAGTIFTDRGRLRDLPGLVEQIAAALRSGYRVQAFPEGTTRCGTSLAVFRRCVFQAALDAAVVVSPVALSYRVDGAPTRQPAFLGEETLVAALRRVLAQPGLTIRMHWLPAIPAIAGTGHPATDRRRLARLVESAVAQALGQPVVGRRQAPAPAPQPRRVRERYLAAS